MSGLTIGRIYIGILYKHEYDGVVRRYDVANRNDNRRQELDMYREGHSAQYRIERTKNQELETRMRVNNYPIGIQEITGLRELIERMEPSTAV